MHQRQIILLPSLLQWQPDSLGGNSPNLFWKSAKKICFAQNGKVFFFFSRMPRSKWKFNYRVLTKSSSLWYIFLLYFLLIRRWLWTLKQGGLCFLLAHYIAIILLDIEGDTKWDRLLKSLPTWLGNTNRERLNMTEVNQWRHINCISSWDKNVL